MGGDSGDGDDTAAGSVAAAGLVGLGLGSLIGAAVFGGPSDPREQFRARLKNRLASHGIELLHAAFGQDPGRAAWVLSVRLPSQQVATLHANVPGAAPFAPATADDVAHRIAAYLGLLAA